MKLCTADLTELQVLSLEHCKQLTRQSMQSISYLSSLETLHLCSCRNITGFQCIKCELVPLIETFPLSRFVNNALTFS